MKKRIPLLVLAGVVFALSGCIPKTSVIEQIAPVVLLYLDQGSDQEIKTATIVPPVKKEKRELIETEGNMILEAKMKLNSNYYREVKSGQIRLIFISEKLASKGVADILNTLYADPSISARTFLAVVEGDMDGYLKENLEQFIDVLLYRQFKHYERYGEVLVQNLHQFLRAYYSSYEDAFLPYFRVENKKLVYSGLAIFYQDKMIGNLSLDEERYFRLLNRTRYNNELLPVEALKITLTNVRSKTYIRHRFHDNNIVINTQISSHLGEYQGHKDLSVLQNYLELKSETEAEIQKEVSGLIEKLQMYGVDPINIGETTKTPFYEPLNKNNWHSQWPNTQVQVVVNLEIDKTGMMSDNK
ncbi:MAG: hypothetical protein JL56_07575 [Desulfotomaculum sp. BICA1-6]|nr:MAG: hypothetical protein JL56_07575 [Desulfotomaculum sp. BICA1-6]